MDRISAMQVFKAVVDQEGFSAASRYLSMPLATVCRKVAELESHLGAQLLVRTTRKVTVTDSGQRFYQDIGRILDDLEEAERQVSGEFQHPKGRLAITAPTLFGRLHVVPVINDFLDTNHDIDIQLTLTNQLVDLLENHINLGVRIGPLPDSSMIALEVGSVRPVTCASPDYLLQQGRPISPNEIARHQCVAFSKSGAPVEWAYRISPKGTQHFPVPARFTLNSIQGSVDSAIRGGGLVQLYSYQAASHVAKSNLEIILEDFELEPVPVSVVYPQGRLVPKKVRAFIDFLAPRLRESLAVVEKQCSAA